MLQDYFIIIIIIIKSLLQCEIIQAVVTSTTTNMHILMKWRWGQEQLNYNENNGKYLTENAKHRRYVSLDTVPPKESDTDLSSQLGPPICVTYIKTAAKEAKKIRVFHIRLTDQQFQRHQ
jgi:hypothetical protein